MDANGDRQLLNGRHFLFVGNHLDNKIKAGTFTLKNHTGNRVSESSGPALKKKLDVMVARLTG